MYLSEFINKTKFTIKKIIKFLSIL